MYSALASVMGAFVALVTLVTGVLVMARAGVFAWPWQLFWVQSVLWEVLNLAVLVAVSIIWAPSRRARLLATSVQLTMTDDYDAHNHADSAKDAGDGDDYDYGREGGEGGEPGGRAFDGRHPFRDDAFGEDAHGEEEHFGGDDLDFEAAGEEDPAIAG